MKLFRLLAVLLISLLPVKQIFAQADADERLDKYRSQKVSFLTERMNLTPEEAQKFWPIYNEYSDKREQVNKEKVKLNRYIAQFSNTITDKEAAELVAKFINLEKQEVQLRDEYNKRFLGIISARKVMMLYQSETQFKAYLIKQLRANSQGGK